jgi:23S rRNA pseudouridine2457 synthase
MTRLVAFNKPFGVICQFSGDGSRPTLKDFIDVPRVYPAGRLDTDSEGLLLLTDDGQLQARIAHPRNKLDKEYWVQVEGIPGPGALQSLIAGVDLGDFVSAPAKAAEMPEPPRLWARNPPIRDRKSLPTSWIRLSIVEGKNRQVRRMTAAVGLPTLRLIRARIGPWGLGELMPGQWVDLPIPARKVDRDEKSQ